MTITEIHWTAQAGYPILATLQLLPLAGVMLAFLLRRRPGIMIPVAILVAVLELLLALDLLRRFDSSQASMQFTEYLSLLPPLSYHAAVDGVGVLFMLVTALVSLLVILYSMVRELWSIVSLYKVVFAIEATLMSMFTTMDLLWFLLVSALELLLVGYMLWRWATSPEKNLMFTRFLQFMGASILLLAAGTLMLGWQYADSTGGCWSFNLYDLMRNPVPDTVSSVIFFLLFYGLAIRIPLFPLHGWLPLAAEHGTVAIAPVYLLSLKVGIFGLLRFVFPILPDAVWHWHKYVVAFAIAGIFYAAMLALLQVNLRRLLAFAVVSHTSILIIGLFSLSHAAFQGAVILSVTFGLATAGLLFMSGLVFRRTHSMLLSRLGGLFDYIPLIGVTFLLAGLSIIGMPGTPGFDAAHLVLEAAIHRYGALVTMAAALGNVVAAGFLLRAFQRTFLASGDSRKDVAVEPATPMEQLISIIMIVILLGSGFYSEPWLKLTDKSLENISMLFSHTDSAGPEHASP